VASSSSTTAPISSPTKSSVRYIWIAAVTLPDSIPEPVPCLVAPVAQDIASKLWKSSKKGAVYMGASLANGTTVVLPRRASELSMSEAAPPPERTVVHSNPAHPPQQSPPQQHTDKKAATLDVQVACRNDSTTPIQRVQVSLLERLSWHTLPISTVDATTGTCRTSFPRRVLQRSADEDARQASSMVKANRHVEYILFGGKCSQSCDFVRVGEFVVSHDSTQMNCNQAKETRPMTSFP
jgi:hypothetical protein